MTQRRRFLGLPDWIVFLFVGLAFTGAGFAFLDGLNYSNQQYSPAATKGMAAFQFCIAAISFLNAAIAFARRRGDG